MKIMTKPFAALLVAVLFLAVTLVGCGDSSDAADTLISQVQMVQNGQLTDSSVWPDGFNAEQTKRMNQAMLGENAYRVQSTKSLSSTQEEVTVQASVRNLATAYPKALRLYEQNLRAFASSEEGAVFLAQSSSAVINERTNEYLIAAIDEACKSVPLYELTLTVLMEKGSQGWGAQSDEANLAKVFQLIYGCTSEELTAALKELSVSMGLE